MSAPKVCAAVLDTCGPCARPPGHPQDCLTLTGALGCAANANGPTGVIHVRDMGPLPRLGERGPIYLGRPMPRHPDKRVQRGSSYRNRWRIEPGHDRAWALGQYLHWLQSSPQGQALTTDHPDWSGMVLACWCAPVGQILTAWDPIVCHCQLVAALLDGIDPEEALHR